MSQGENTRNPSKIVVTSKQTGFYSRADFTRNLRKASKPDPKKK